MLHLLRDVLQQLELLAEIVCICPCATELSSSFKVLAADGRAAFSRMHFSGPACPCFFHHSLVSMSTVDRGLHTCLDSLSTGQEDHWAGVPDFHGRPH